MLKLRNGRAGGDDIPAGFGAEEGEDFLRVLEDLLDLLHERWAGQGEGPPGQTATPVRMPGCAPSM